jgi:hypothetical protein
LLGVAKKLHHAIEVAMVGGRLCQISLFEWVGPKVEELSPVDLGIDDELPAIIADGTLDLCVGREYRSARSFGAVRKHRD